MRGCNKTSTIALVLCAWCSKKEAPRGAADAAPGVAPVASAAAKPAIPTDLDVILITIDCLRADMPWNGYERPIAPRLTELAQKSVNYTNAYSLSSYTSMSIGGLLSSRLPGELDRDGFFFGSYGEKNLFFPEILQKNGVATLAGHAHGYFKGTGLNQGFDQWEMVADLKWSNQTDENITSPDLEAIAERLLADPSLDKKRFFAWFHFLDPHDRYMDHEGIDWGNKQTRDRYDVEVTFTDRYIGKLLDFVAKQSWSKRAAFVVTGDHGESFGEHKQYLHGFELWQNLVRVPLFFVVPGVAPRTIDEPRSAIDLAPTILDLYGLAAEPTFRGKSVVPELLGKTPEPRDILLDLPRTSDNDARRALVSGTKKIIGYGQPEYFVAYDLQADPEESKQIWSGPVFDEMRAKYKEATKSVEDAPPTKCKEGCLAGAYLKDGGL